MSSLSSYITTDTQDQLSVEYKNLYSIDGVIYYFSLSNESLPLVNKFTDSHPWVPQVKVFNSEEEIETYLALFQNKQQIRLSTLGDNLWYGNIGHALWDGLYPLYLALVKFGYKDDSFTLLSSPWHNKQTMAYDMITKFSSNKLLEYQDLDKSKLIHFETLVAGTGCTGNRVMSTTYTLYGEKEYGALTLFKERLLKSYNIDIDKPINKKPKAIIIKNKRFSNYEISVIRKVIDFYKEVLDIKYIDWYHDYKSFKDQLKELEDVDIHITGPGTGMMYMPFLKKDAVNVNLGYIEHTQTNTSRPNIFISNSKVDDFLVPGYMEQSVCAGADYVSTIYYDRYTYNNLEFEPLVNLIKEAISIVNKEKTVESNHFIDAKIYIEYCKRCKNPKQVVAYLTGLAFFIELFINEHPATMNDKIIDINLLRSIKQEFGFNNKYKITI